MKVNAKDTRRGFTWLLVAGVAAVGLSFFLYSSDNFLSNWQYDEELEATLIELRGAQAAVGEGSSDVRIDQAERFLNVPLPQARSVDYSLSEPKKKKDKAHGDSHGH